MLSKQCCKAQVCFLKVLIHPTRKFPALCRKESKKINFIHTTNLVKKTQLHIAELCVRLVWVFLVNASWEVQTINPSHLHSTAWRRRSQPGKVFKRLPNRRHANTHVRASNGAIPLPKARCPPGHLPAWNSRLCCNTGTREGW